MKLVKIALVFPIVALSAVAFSALPEPVGRTEESAFRVACLNVGHYEVFDPVVAKEKYESEWKRFFAENPADAFFLEEAGPGQGAPSLDVRIGSGLKPVERGFLDVTNSICGRSTRCRTAIRLVYRIGGKTLAVYGMHMVPEGHISKVKDPKTGRTPSQELRQLQYEDLLRDAARFDSAILTGDFNAQEPWEYGIFTKRGYTIANCSPRYGTVATLRDIPADNIILSPGMEFADFRIPTRADYVLSTDHRPLLATVRLRGLTAD